MELPQQLDLRQATIFEDESMFTSNPFAELSSWISPGIMQAYIIAMIILVIGGTIFDVLHKKSAKYFSENMRKAKDRATRGIGSGEKVSIAVKTAVVDVAASGEFCNPKRRIAHLLTMYGFIVYALTTATMIFKYPTAVVGTPAILPQLWHLGALMVCIGGYWFWFFIRADVSAEGNSPFRVMRADLFILSLLGSATFALIWSYLQAADSSWMKLFFHMFVTTTTILFGTVIWSKFAHMFFKPAAAFQKRVAKADGSMDGLPEPADKPEQFGPGIKRLLPKNY
jgi:predicted small integral membrane protein